MTISHTMTKAVRKALKADVAVQAAVKAATPYLLTPLTDKALRKLALEIVEGKVFGSWMLHDLSRELQTTFMVLLFCDRMPDNIGEVYEYYSEAGPMACNGKPTFFSCRMLAQEDTAPLNVYIKQIQEQRKAFMADDNDT